MTSSIRLNLLKWLIGPLLAVNLVGAGLTYWLAWIPAQVAFDQSVADSIWALLPHLRENANRLEVDLSKQAEEVLRVDHFDTVYFAVRDGTGGTIGGDRDFPPLRTPAESNEPITYDGIMRGEPVRIATLRTVIGNKQVLIGAAETLRKRRDMRAEILLGLLLLEGTLVAVLVVAVWLAVSRGILPLKEIETTLNARRHDDLSAIAETDVPSELRPVVGALNGLLTRAQEGAEARQDFLANVAHQLRTPLAGLRTQLDWLQHKYSQVPDTAHSAALMISSVERMIRQTNQLLALARAEPSQHEKKHLEAVKLDQLVGEAVQHFVQEADKKSIDIGFNLQPTRIVGDRFLLHDLIDNLVDNAIRYSPHGGTVTVSCFQGQATGTFMIEDCGPGIPEADREKIFSRFYRLDDEVTGSGLGLSIVRDIATSHEAKITLRTGSEGSGTIFSVEFPAAD